jgi:hypothetical protein
VYEVKSGDNAGKWRCQVTLPGGKRRTFLGTKEEAEVKLLEFQNAVGHHEPLPPSRTVRVEKYATDWAASRKAEVALVHGRVRTAIFATTSFPALAEGSS